MVLSPRGDAMSYRLIGGHGPQRIDHPLPEGISTVGRSTSNDLVLPSSTVSRNHAEIRRRGDSVTVVDLGSLNGTRVDGEQLVPRTPFAVEIGGRIEFGRIALRLAALAETSTPSWTEADRDLETHARGTLPVPQDPRLLGLLLEGGLLAPPPEDPARAFDSLLELVEQVLPVSRIVILLSDDDGELVTRAQRARGPEPGSSLLLTRAAARRIVADGMSAVTSESRWGRHPPTGDRRFLAAPVRDDRSVLGVLYVESSDDRIGSERDRDVLTLLGRVLGGKIAAARRIEQLQDLERVKQELQQARRMQIALLPLELPKVPGYEFAGRQDMCAEVGGDFYDVSILPGGRISILLGDVTGKGMGAAVLMADLLGTTRALLAMGHTVGEVVAHLQRHLLRSTATEVSATLFLGELDPASHRLHYVSAGHPSALLLCPGGEIRELKATGPPVGFDLGLEFETESDELPRGSNLVLYSDGVIEAQRSEDEFFSDRELPRVLDRCFGTGAPECVRTIEAALDAFLGNRPQTDDMTLLVARRVDVSLPDIPADRASGTAT